MIDSALHALSSLLQKCNVWKKYSLINRFPKKNSFTPNQIVKFFYRCFLGVFSSSYSLKYISIGDSLPK